MKPIVPAPSRAKSIEGQDGEALVRIGAAGWHEDEDGFRYFRFVCYLEGDTPPDWPLATIWGSQFVLRPAESGAADGASTRHALSAPDDLNSLTKQLPIGEHQAGGRE